MGKRPGWRARLAELDISRVAAIAVGLGGLCLAIYGLLPGLEVSDSWFQAGVLVLLGSVLLEVQGERRTLAETISRLQRGDRASGPHESRTDTYVEASRMIRETEPASKSDAIILLSSLHGHAGPLVESPAFAQADGSDAALLGFRHAIEARLRDDWQLRQVVSFISEQRMDAFLVRLAAFPTDSRVEVRAFAETSGIPAVSTLVVARRAAMLALDDDRIFGVGSAVKLDGPELARWSEDHFKSLWDAAHFTIWRPATGRDDIQIEALRRAMNESATPEHIVIDLDGPGSYERATASIHEEIARPGEIRIDLANLHGLASGHRNPRLDLVQPWITAFEDALDLCLITHAERSYVRAIYNVNSLERLQAVTAKLDRWAAADRLEVRALMLGDAVATISPLIVGESELFLGVEGDRLYRTARSMRLRSGSAASWGREYFELVWNDRRAITLRTPNGIVDEGLRNLESRLSVPVGDL